MAAYVSPGVWKCNFCERILPESDYATDGWRKLMGKGPGRCQQCETELGRAKCQMSPTGKYTDTPQAAAYAEAKEVCRAHMWGEWEYAVPEPMRRRERV